MKKILLAALCATLSCSFASAQELSDIPQAKSGANGLAIGVGFVHNWYINDNFEDRSAPCYFGPYIELGYDFFSDSMNSLYIAARYEFVHHYGGIRANTILGYLYTDAYTYRHYIDIPLKYRFACKLDFRNKFFFDLGPTFNFFLGSFSYINNYTPQIWSSAKIDWFKDYPDVFNWFNVSLGANIGFMLGNSRLFAGYDYGGLISYTKDDFGKGQVHQLRIGYSYVF